MQAWENPFQCGHVQYCMMKTNAPLEQPTKEEWALVNLHIITVPEGGGRCLVVNWEHDALRTDLLIIQDVQGCSMSCDEHNKTLQLRQPGMLRKIKFTDIADYWCFLLHYASGRIRSRSHVVENVSGSSSDDVSGASSSRNAIAV